jgi:hypothetical protein
MQVKQGTLHNPLQQTFYDNAERELLLHINRRMYEQNVIFEELYNKAAQAIVDGLTNR